MPEVTAIAHKLCQVKSVHGTLQETVGTTHALLMQHKEYFFCYPTRAARVILTVSKVSGLGHFSRPVQAPSPNQNA